jgi:hypothetical protein
LSDFWNGVLPVRNGAVIDLFGRADVKTGDNEADVQAEFGSFDTPDGAPVWPLVVLFLFLITSQISYLSIFRLAILMRLNQSVAGADTRPL